MNRLRKGTKYEYIRTYEDRVVSENELHGIHCVRMFVLVRSS